MPIVPEPTEDADTARTSAGELLPRPRHLRLASGVFGLTDGMAVCLDPRLEAPERAAAQRLCELCSSRLGVRMAVRTGSDGGLDSIFVGLDEGSNGGQSVLGSAVSAADQGYGLQVSPREVEIIGRSPAGAMYGVLTLCQVALDHGGEWPCMEIDDWPDFVVRGLSYDVSRGKVPTLEALKELVDRLAAYKLNHLQLYIEHTFAFAFDPDIGAGCSPLTADEIRELDDYCASRRVDLVPSLASFGHMGRVLSLPRNRHLAEIAAERSWLEMSWTERMHGLTLDMANPESRQLLERMYDELLPLFRTPLMNVCCDETYDLGRGKNRERAERVGVGELYMEHLAFLDGLCRRHGKRMMVWGDIVKKHPELTDRLPAGAIMLNWGYAPDSDYESTALFTGAGMTTFVCPGTSAWNRVLNDINAADLNIRRYAAAGREHGAVGMLNTDWGDEGHVNLLAGGWHPLMLGAAMAWNCDGPDEEAFDRAFGRQVLGDESGAVVAALRRLVAASDMTRSWPAFCEPLAECVPEDVLASAKLADWRELAAEAEEVLVRHAATAGGERADVSELVLCCRLSALVAERFDLSRRLAGGSSSSGRVAEELLLHFAEGCDRIVPDYEKAWLARNKPSCLHEVTAVFKRLAGEARALVGVRP